MWWLGTQPPEVIAAAERNPEVPLRSLHTDMFHPVPEPTIKTGVLTLSVAVMSILGK